MENKDIIKKGKEVQEKINELLRNFTLETQCEVNEIRLETIDVSTQEKKDFIYKTSLQIYL